MGWVLTNPSSSFSILHPLPRPKTVDSGRGRHGSRPPAPHPPGHISPSADTGEVESSSVADGLRQDGGGVGKVVVVLWPVGQRKEGRRRGVSRMSTPRAPPLTRRDESTRSTRKTPKTRDRLPWYFNSILNVCLRRDRHGLPPSPIPVRLFSTGVGTLTHGPRSFTGHLFRSPFSHPSPFRILPFFTSPVLGSGYPSLFLRRRPFLRRLGPQ